MKVEDFIFSDGKDCLRARHKHRLEEGGKSLFALGRLGDGGWHIMVTWVSSSAFEIELR